MMYNLQDRILGCLVTAGMGDAVGVPSEAMSRDEIYTKFGGPIDRFLDANDNPLGVGNDLGEVTDDASQMYEMARAVISTGGKLTTVAAAKALVDWSEKYPKYCPRNAGPTMREVLSDLKAGKDPVVVGKTGMKYYRGVSNGAVMRIASAGLCYPGNLDETVKVAVTMTKVSHGTQIAYAGAAAIACGIAEAITENAQIHSIIQAAIYGARKGEEIGMQEARIASGTRLLPKIAQVLECAYLAEDAEQAGKMIEEYVGNDGNASTSAAAALGLFIASDGDPIATILNGANLGGDTDTISCIAGMLAGAYKGFSAIPADWYATFKKGNPMLDFEWAAEELTKIAQMNS